MFDEEKADELFNSGESSFLPTGFKTNFFEKMDDFFNSNNLINSNLFFLLAFNISFKLSSGEGNIIFFSLLL